MKCQNQLIEVSSSLRSLWEMSSQSSINKYDALKSNPVQAEIAYITTGFPVTAMPAAQVVKRGPCG